MPAAPDPTIHERIESLEVQLSGLEGFVDSAIKRFLVADAEEGEEGDERSQVLLNIRQRLSLIEDRMKLYEDFQDQQREK